MSVLTKYQNAALRYDKHISLTANAGSGKTTVLSKRFVEILLKENINLNNIVAITFTEKAASELYSKIAKELDERIISANGITKIKLETLRRNLVSAKISTIHSFCIEILKDYAPVAGIDANFSPVDKRTSDEILQQSMDEIIVKNLKEDNTEIKNLIRLFGNKTLLANKIKLLFGKRKTTEKLIENYYSKSEIEIAEWLKNSFENKFTLVFETLINELIPEVIELNNIAGGDKTTEIFIEVNRLINELNSKENLIDRFILLKEIANQILTNSGTVKKQKIYQQKALRRKHIFS
ncbi:MAG: UvrD-helicase domain-containing protein [Ignavibacteriales bacterium]|nr:UvrD-helicase domain-containing protein [Ignavibacteriales bacterium]